jgi:hypothetical protein
MQEIANVRGRAVFSADGARVGSVRSIYYNEVRSTPEWVGLGTGFPGMRERVVPVESLTLQGDRLQLPFTKETVQNQPSVRRDENSIVDADEDRLASHFHLMGERHSTKVLHPHERYRGPML